MSTLEFQLRISRLLELFDTPMMRLETLSMIGWPEYILTIGNLGKTKRSFTGQSIEELLDKAESELL